MRCAEHGLSRRDEGNFLITSPLSRIIYQYFTPDKTWPRAARISLTVPLCVYRQPSTSTQS